MYRLINGKIYKCIETSLPVCDSKSSPKGINIKNGGIVINFFDEDPGGTTHGGADPSDIEEPIETSPEPKPAEPPSSELITINYYYRR